MLLSTSKERSDCKPLLSRVDWGRFIRIVALILPLLANQASYAFEYRGVYTPSNRDQTALVRMASNNIDYDWGLWGHNLHKVVGDEQRSEIFAWIDGKRNKQQYCFSSPLLYQLIEAYILTNWGEEVMSRISIMPNDNAIVCQCDSCLLLGNTAQSATPAVSKMVVQLAKRFPKHAFYTSDYLTTSEVTTLIMPPNVGVILSAIELPMQVDVASMNQAVIFKEKVNKWKQKVNRIYVWDYIRNFDDYLSPYPMLGVVQQRLTFYDEIGVKGIIFNGSGEDYALFDDFQTYLLQKLLVNPSADVKREVESYLTQAYPTTHELLATYYLTLEDRVAKKGVVLPYYEGIESISKSYLYPDEFERFYQQLFSAALHVDGAERIKLNKMVTAMQFTRLELMRMPGAPYSKEAEQEMIELFEGYKAFSDMQHFKESGGKIADYIDERSTMKIRNERIDNLLKNKKMRYSNGADSEELILLTDGCYGLPIDYHLGWLITDQKELSILFPTFEGVDNCTIKIGVMVAEAWNIFLPKSIEIWSGSGVVVSLNLNTTQLKSDSPMRLEAEAVIPIQRVVSPLELRITNSSLSTAKLAIDEVEIYACPSSQN